MSCGKLGRTGAHRKAMFRNSVTSLFEHERIRTTMGKAKLVKPEAEKLITLAKRGAVSYTHLDVYKRQVQAVPPRRAKTIS